VGVTFHQPTCATSFGAGGVLHETGMAGWSGPLRPSGRCRARGQDRCCARVGWAACGGPAEDQVGDGLRSLGKGRAALACSTRIRAEGCLRRPTWVFGPSSCDSVFSTPAGVNTSSSVRKRRPGLSAQGDHGQRAGTTCVNFACRRATSRRACACARSATNNRSCSRPYADARATHPYCRDHRPTTVRDLSNSRATFVTLHTSPRSRYTTNAWTDSPACRSHGSTTPPVLHRAAFLLPMRHRIPAFARSQGWATATTTPMPAQPARVLSRRLVKLLPGRG